MHAQPLAVGDGRINPFSPSNRHADYFLKDPIVAYLLAINSMENILERTQPVRSDANPIGPSLKDIASSQTINSPFSASTTSSHTSNTYANLQPPPKPPFNYSANLHLITVELQESAPPKPISPKSEQLNSLIYTTLKEIQPTTWNSKSPSPLDIHENNLAPNGKFMVTPVVSEGCPTPNTYVESVSSHSSNAELESKHSTPPEPLKFITVPEDFVKLDRRSILRARFRKSIEYARRALAFILSHVGLSLMVIGYTFLGAVVFCSVEKESERQTKAQMVVLFNDTVTQLMDLWIKSYFNLSHMIDFIRWAALMNRTLEIHNQAKQGLEGLDWYLKGLELSNEVIPRHWLEGIMAENSSTTFQSSVNSTTPTASSLPLESTASTPTATTPSPAIDFTAFPSIKNLTTDFPYNELIMMTINGSSNASQVSNITLLVDSFRDNVTRIMTSYVSHVVRAIKDEGWNGASNIDDINWTFEGGVLFAITVFTTIGYGHVTPQTPYGKLLTIIYAVIGIPLFFCYLSKTGDMMASVFRLAYARGCKPVFRMLRRRRGRGTNENGIFTSMQSLARIANLDATVMQLHRKGSTTSNDSNNRDRNPSIHSGKTSRSEGSPPISNPIKRSKSSRPRGKSRGKAPKLLKRSVSTRSLRELRRNAVVEIRDQKASETGNFLNVGKQLDLPPSRSLDSSNRQVKRMLARVAADNALTANAISDGPNHISLRRKLIIQNVPKPQADEKTVNVPISLTLCMMFIYILIGATVFCMWEKQDYIKWSYFCFVTLSTIGFGDIVPGTKIDSENPKEKMIALILYVAIGLSFFAMCFKLMEEEAMNKLRRIGQRMGIIKRPEDKRMAKLIEATDLNPINPMEEPTAIIVTQNNVPT